MENKATDLSARLLATENLSVVRARTQTASFDIKSRVLTLPMWKDMTPEIEDMLIGHEVGHALYTLDQYMDPIKENPKIQSYLNVLEDVRIEKLIKRKYPGLRKKMNEGYMQLNERDFFGVKQVPSLDDLLLIDKINLYFKAGFQCGVTFSPEEKTLVNRAERTETVEDVIQLAKEVWEYSKQKAEERKERMKAENPQDSEEAEDPEDQDDMDPIEQDFDFDEDGEWEQKPSDKEDDQLDPVDKSDVSTDESKKEDEEPDLESKTERAFASKLEDLADESTEYIYWKFDNEYYENPIVGYKTVLNETRNPETWTHDEMSEKDWQTRNMSETERDAFYAQFSGDFDAFKTESTRTVNYLVKEFEMKKSAQMYKRAQVSKIGSLDMRKIYAYKLQDDLFKRVTTIPKGKNHGMMMLVDWSGSMNDVLIDTMKQVINLAMFCNRVQIPYRVYAFTSSYNEDLRYTLSVDEFRKYHEDRREFAARKHATKENLVANTDGFHLLELFSNKMTTSEFNTMSRRILDHRFTWNTGYATGGTPLNEALVWCYQNIGEYIKNSGIEKMTFITLTDGEGGALHHFGGRYFDDSRSIYTNGVYKKIKIKHLIRDEQTQKTYELDRHSALQTETILRMIKDRHNISVVGFHICENRRGNLNSVLNCNLPRFRGDSYSVIEAWRKEFKQNGFASLKNTGRDDLFLIPQESTKIQEGELEVSAEANSRAIARNFGKYLNVKKTSRVLLNRFIALVA
jgi:hypothetical protein